MDLMDYFKSVISLICTKVQTGKCDILLDLRNQILILITDYSPEFKAQFVCF